ncbi:hypothetical protein KR044_002222 [Drosophila immigrans]|nr:hypothetical protein KR044_002222 [Drosophila immigrans]
MPSAKQLLAKLARFFQRIKPSTTPRIIDDNQRVRSAAATTTRKQKQRSKPETETKTKAKVMRITATGIERRMEAGHDAEAGDEEEDEEEDEGPILEAGISRLAFCRKLDNLLQRSLGVDDQRRRPKAAASCC